jgi:hypothetical protein
VARRRRRTRAILGVVVVLALAAAAATILVLDLNQAHTNAREKKAAAAQAKATAGVQIIGTVIAVDASGVTLRLSNGTARRLTLTASTLVENATTGAATDVTVGKRGLLNLTPGYVNVAQEVVVLPRTAHFGLPIARAGFGTVWLRDQGVILAGVNMSRAKIDNARRATRADIVPGVVLLSHARTTVTRPIRFTATEVVVLPPGSSFS